MKFLRALGIAAVLFVMLLAVLFWLTLATDSGRDYWKNRSDYSEGRREARLAKSPEGIEQLMAERPEWV